MYSCNGTKAPNTELKTELLQAQHETQLLKLQSELDLERAKQATIDSMQLLKNGNYFAANGAKGDSRVTQQADDNRTASSSTNAYRTTPVAVQKKKGLSIPAKYAAERRKLINSGTVLQKIDPNERALKEGDTVYLTTKGMLFPLSKVICWNLAVVWYPTD
jgi:hypothetical protein